MATASVPDFQDDDFDGSLVERRFFAALTAMKTVQDECRVLEDVIRMAEESWRHSRARLIGLEALRDALGKQLTLAPAAMHAERSAA